MKYQGANSRPLCNINNVFTTSSLTDLIPKNKVTPAGMWVMPSANTLLSESEDGKKRQKKEKQRTGSGVLLGPASYDTISPFQLP